MLRSLWHSHSNGMRLILRYTHSESFSSRAHSGTTDDASSSACGPRSAHVSRRSVTRFENRAICRQPSTSRANHISWSVVHQGTSRTRARIAVASRSGRSQASSHSPAEVADVMLMVVCPSRQLLMATRHGLESCESCAAMCQQWLVPQPSRQSASVGDGSRIGLCGSSTPSASSTKSFT